MLEMVSLLRRCPGPEAIEAPSEVGVEPSLNGTGRDPDIGGYVLVLPEPVGRSDDLESAEVLAVGGVSDEWPGGHPWPP